MRGRGLAAGSPSAFARSHEEADVVSPGRPTYREHREGLFNAGSAASATNAGRSADELHALPPRATGTEWTDDEVRHSHRAGRDRRPAAAQADEGECIVRGWSENVARAGLGQHVAGGRDEEAPSEVKVGWAGRSSDRCRKAKKWCDGPQKRSNLRPRAHGGFPRRVALYWMLERPALATRTLGPRRTAFALGMLTARVGRPSWARRRKSAARRRSNDFASPFSGIGARGAGREAAPLIG